MGENLQRIPVDRVITKLDNYMAEGEYEAAERHLKFWLGDASLNHDEAGKLAVLNEMIGFYAKTGKQQECEEAISAALDHARGIGVTELPVMGIILKNAAAALTEFGHYDEAENYRNMALSV